MNPYFKSPRTFTGSKALQGIAALALALGLSTAGAATLSLSTSTQAIAAGTNVSVALDISGLSPSSLGAYDLTVQYANPIWNFTGGAFGSALGATFGDTMAVDGNGFLHLSQVSLESPSTLSTQPSSFTLATLNFIVSNSIASLSGSTSMFTSGVTLSDAVGGSLDASNGSLSFQIADAPTPSAVPIPAAWLLFSTGLALIEGSRRWATVRGKA